MCTFYSLIDKLTQPWFKITNCDEDVTDPDKLQQIKRITRTYMKEPEQQRKLEILSDILKGQSTNRFRRWFRRWIRMYEFDLMTTYQYIVRAFVWVWTWAHTTIYQVLSSLYIVISQYQYLTIILNLEYSMLYTYFLQNHICKSFFASNDEVPSVKK